MPPRSPRPRRFEQQVLDRTGKIVERASGTFAFARPGKFRWTYEKPIVQVLVGDGTKLWIHDPDLNQVTVKRVDGAVSSTPAALLAGRDDIAALFTLRDAGTADGLEWVGGDAEIRRHGVRPCPPRAFRKNPCRNGAGRPVGGPHDAAFLGLKANVAIPPDTFRFVPPKGADVIEDAAPEALSLRVRRRL